jgi:16S rRNA processing protein RimM
MADDGRQSDPVCLARVATAHGVRGAVRLRCFTERPEDVVAYGPLRDRSGRRQFELRLIGHAQGGVIASIEGVRDRAAALALRGLELCVPRAALPSPEPDEFYINDLIGLEVLRVGGERFGTVRQCDNHGAGDVLEIVTEDGRRLSLPFDRSTVPEVDLERGLIVVDPPDELFGGRP